MSRKKTMNIFSLFIPNKLGINDMTLEKGGKKLWKY